MDYSDNFGEPVWASWDLTTADVGSAQRQDDYRPDTSLPANFYEVTTTDYNGVGNIDFNRGHMCPSEDRTDTTNDNSLLFLMDNIIPQAATNNQGVWGNFETYCRTQASGGNELLIICGPSGFGTNRIPSGKAAIANYTWKIAVVVPLGAGTGLSRITAATRVISVKIPNSNDVVSTWQTYVTNAGTIENDTGFTFFTALPANVATVFRNVIDGQTPPAPTIAGFSPSSGATNTSVTITGTNFIFATNVTFNGVNAAFTINSSNSITATVPTGASTGPIKVWGLGGNVTSSSNFVTSGATVPDLAIRLSHPGNFIQGDIGDTCTIIVTNVGTAASSGSVTVTDSLPAGLTATAISGTGWTTNLGTLTATRSDALLAGSAYPPITITVNVAANATSVTNSATVSGGGDSNSANNTANDPTTVNAVGAPDLAVIAAHTGNFTQGDIGDTYTIIVTNVGGGVSSGSVTVSDALPSGLTAAAISGTGWTTNLGALTATRSDTLAAGSAYPAITVMVNVATNAPTSVTNSATVSGGGESNTADDTADDTTTINALVSGGGASNIVISQIYGGGGNTGASYQNDFVELFNPSPLTVSLTGWSIQYASAAGTTWGNRANLSGSIAPYHYYLIEMASGGTVGALLPVPDATSTSINMSATSGKVALVSNQTPLTGSNPIGSPGVVDFVGYGSSANAFEGSGPTASLSNTSSAVRNNGGLADSNNNTNDFSVASPPTPRNSSSPANSPGVADLVVALSHSSNFTQGDTNDTYTLIVTNIGAVASSGTISVANFLPAGLTAIAISGSGWTANLGAPTATRSDVLAAGGSFPAITVTVSVATNAPSLVTNLATVSGGGETNSANDSASDPTTIIALAPLQQWRLQYFGTTANSGAAADGAIAGSDGIPNLLKYAWGLNPLVPANSPVLGDISTGFLRLTSPKNPNATDIMFRVQVTGSLISGWTTNGTTIDQNTSTLFQAHDNTPVGGATARYIRLQVSDP